MNKEILYYVATGIAFLSGFFAVFFVKTFEKKQLTKWGIFTIILLIISTFISVRTKIIENESTTLENNRLDSIRKGEHQFDSTYYKNVIDSLNVSLLLQHINIKTDSQSNIVLNRRLTQTLLNLNNLYEISASNFKHFDSLQEHSLKKLQSANEILIEVNKLATTSTLNTDKLNYPLVPAKISISFSYKLDQDYFLNIRSHLKVKTIPEQEVVESNILKLFRHKKYYSAFLAFRIYGGYINLYVNSNHSNIPNLQYRFYSPENQMEHSLLYDYTFVHSLKETQLSIVNNDFKINSLLDLDSARIEINIFDPKRYPSSDNVYPNSSDNEISMWFGNNNEFYFNFKDVKWSSKEIFVSETNVKGVLRFTTTLSRVKFSDSNINLKQDVEYK